MGRGNANGERPEASFASEKSKMLAGDLYPADYFELSRDHRPAPETLEKFNASSVVVRR